ncbi:hypothetical protein PSTT_15421 [Puccinia striiformis]|uniref:Uncharacterized protein n=1 Tax=Puccinia striiformis TaxID=27350 RepID=A0A2S4UI07_9BASI|nr:hypothetical protein PSTT_15421 [Puccinia striiformis]
MPSKKTVQVKGICLCSSYGCSTHIHMESEGELCPGVILARNTVRNHCLANLKSRLSSLNIPTHVDRHNPNIVQRLNSLSLGLSPSPLPLDTAQAVPPNSPSPTQEEWKQQTFYDSSTFFRPSLGGLLLIFGESFLGCFYLFSLKSSDPSTVQTSLVAAILSTFYQCSSCVISWFLKSQKDFHQLKLGSSLTSAIHELAYSNLATIREIPHPTSSRVPLPVKNRICSAPLFKSRGINTIPIHTYGFQDLHAWITKLFSCPEIEDALDRVSLQLQAPFDPQAHVHDNHDSLVWKQLVGPDRQQFTASSNNLLFCLYTDAINAFGNRQAGKHASITFLIMVCLTLPVDLRFLPEDIYIAGITPDPVFNLQGHINPLVAGMSTQPFFLANLPATRQTLGFSSTSCDHLCSYSLLTQDEITNFDPSSWLRRTTLDHRIWAQKSHAATSDKDKEAIFDKNGLRYLCLLELEYWDIVNMHTFDSMHNLLLGLLKWHLKALLDNVR